MQERNVEVFLRIPRLGSYPYDMPMGYTSVSDANMFMEMLRRPQPLGQSCMQSFAAHYEESAVYVNSRTGSDAPHSRRLILGNVQLAPGMCAAPCAADIHNYAIRTRNCAECIMAGKCTDPVGQIIGSFLYPQLYAAKIKGKTK